MSFVFWRVTSSHGMLKNIQRTLGANLSGFLMLRMFEHISIGPLVVWPDWMPLSECDHHWMQLNALECALSAREHLWASIERAWTHSECVWMPLSEHWMHLNTLECTWMPLCESECDWEHLTTDSYIKISVHECLWASVNAIECIWMHPECTWMHLSEYWMCLKALWVHMNAFEWVLNATEGAWVHMNATEWVLNLCQCAPLVEVIKKKIDRDSSNWMREWNERSF